MIEDYTRNIIELEENIEKTQVIVIKYENSNDEKQKEKADIEESLERLKSLMESEKLIFKKRRETGK